MARRDREPALRIRLVPDTEAIVSRTGIHFVRGREAFYLDGRGARKLAEIYSLISEVGFDEALSRLLSVDSSGSTPD